MSTLPFPNITIEAIDLACKRGERMLFGGLGFALSNGELLQVRGSNGIGKSSLLRILSGLLAAPSGTLTLTIGEESDDTLAHDAHYLAHDNALKSSLTVFENLNFWRNFAKDPGIPAAEALERVALPHLGNLPAGVLSAGQKRRIAFARLLVGHRPIWLLDEPTAALDRESDALIGQIVSEHVHQGGVVIAATHLPLKLDLPQEAIKTLEMSDFQVQAYADSDAIA